MAKTPATEKGKHKYKYTICDGDVSVSSQKPLTETELNIMAWRVMRPIRWYANNMIVVIIESDI